ncbi:hypothetical protein ALC56_12204 [Trachymyrmex septentrionalis]|uniref:CUE domain-containing protein n=1 Tax=Trachymyrmex septentrionalis TaxID=34720 RepID=A0A195F005_9HYME|nr:hypothetical protein ALC56_12204 [Trachymyrmex septentrionalis]
MGECHCSNITIMQLFHELKQQFPALPDHVVSQCIAQVHRWPLSVRSVALLNRPSKSRTRVCSRDSLN